MVQTYHWYERTLPRQITAVDYTITVTSVFKDYVVILLNKIVYSFRYLWSMIKSQSAHQYTTGIDIIYNYVAHIPTNKAVSC